MSEGKRNKKPTEYITKQVAMTNVRGFLERLISLLAKYRL